MEAWSIGRIEILFFYKYRFELIILLLFFLKKSRYIQLWIFGDVRPISIGNDLLAMVLDKQKFTSINLLYH